MSEALGKSVCVCGAEKGRASGRKAPRMVTCLPCWRRVPRKLRRAFGATEKGSFERVQAIREIFAWLKETFRPAPTLEETNRKVLARMNEPSPFLPLAP